MIATALINKAISLAQAGQDAEALASYDDLLGRFGDSEDPNLQLYVARALFSKGSHLGDHSNPEAALPVYDDFLTRFSKTENGGLQIGVATTYLKKAIYLISLGRLDEAEASYNHLINDMDAEKNVTLRQYIAMAQQGKSELEKQRA